MVPFRKRIYTGFSAFWSDIRFLIAHRRQLRRIMREKTVDPKMRERLMLAVTQVNECRFCSRFHSKLALTEGVGRDEVAAILHGEFGGCPPEELPAILYAHHWAETEGGTEPDARAKMEETYGPAVAGDIDLVLRLIKAGNYTGNTADYFLYRLSFGRLGI